MMGLVRRFLRHPRMLRKVFNASVDDTIKQEQYRTNPSLVNLGKDVDIRNCTFGGLNRIDSHVTIHNTCLGYGSTIAGGCRLYGPLEIGRYTQLGYNTIAIARNHAWRSLTCYDNKVMFDGRRKTLASRAKITVGNDVWIGANAVLLAGVVLHDGCVVGAGAVVTHDVEPFSIVGGVPARIIRKRFEDHLCGQIESSAWWNLSVEELEECEDIFMLESLTDTASHGKVLDGLLKLGRKAAAGQNREEGI